METRSDNVRSDFRCQISHDPAYVILKSLNVFENNLNSFDLTKFLKGNAFNMSKIVLLLLF